MTADPTKDSLVAYFAGIVDNGGYVSMVETRGRPMPSISFVTYYPQIAQRAVDVFGCGHVTEKSVGSERINRHGVSLDTRYRWCVSWDDARAVAAMMAPHLVYYAAAAKKLIG